MEALGWLPTDWAKAAKVSDMTVSRVLRNLRANPRTLGKLAKALGKPLSRYQIKDQPEPQNETVSA